MKEDNKCIKLVYNSIYFVKITPIGIYAKCCSYADSTDIQNPIIRKGNYFWYFHFICVAKVDNRCI